jgi:hypothetical protein
LNAKEPFTHTLHAVKPVVIIGVTLPTAHVRHAELSAAAYVPELHMTHVELPRELAAEPSAHGIHSDACASE